MMGSVFGQMLAANCALITGDFVAGTVVRVEIARENGQTPQITKLIKKYWLNILTQV